MEWRCEWCGKPHADDDPPCDNCGHGSFEKAVVRQPAEGPAGDSTTVWLCTECGREHPKHAPPCSRCGNATLERREATVDDSELIAPGYLDLVTPQYVLGLVFVLGLAAVFLLGVAGVVDLPGMGSETPGSADSYRGTDLGDVETAYLERFDEQRLDAGAASLRRDTALDQAATAFNQELVTRLRNDERLPADSRVRERLGDACGDRVRTTPVVLPASSAGSTAEEIGGALADERVSQYEATDSAPRGITGIDVHVVDGTFVVTQVVC